MWTQLKYQQGVLLENKYIIARKMMRDKGVGGLGERKPGLTSIQTYYEAAIRKAV